MRNEISFPRARSRPVHTHSLCGALEKFIFMVKGEINKEIKFALSSAPAPEVVKNAHFSNRDGRKKPSIFFQFWIKPLSRDQCANEILGRREIRGPPRLDQAKHLTLL